MSLLRRSIMIYTDSTQIHEGIRPGSLNRPIAAIEGDHQKNQTRDEKPFYVPARRIDAGAHVFRADGEITHGEHVMPGNYDTAVELDEDE